MQNKYDELTAYCRMDVLLTENLQLKYQIEGLENRVKELEFFIRELFDSDVVDPHYHPEVHKQFRRLFLEDQ